MKITILAAGVWLWSFNAFAQVKVMETQSSVFWDSLQMDSIALVSVHLKIDPKGVDQFSLTDNRKNGDLVTYRVVLSQGLYGIFSEGQEMEFIDGSFVLRETVSKSTLPYLVLSVNNTKNKRKIIKL